MQVVALLDEHGRLLGGLSVSRDVTEPRRQERTMVSRTAELERSNAELAQFAYVASHDLSEPLRMVSSYLQLLRRRYGGKLDADADAFIDYAVDGAARMRTLIEDLLAYSRAGRSERPPERSTPPASSREVASTLRALADDEPPVIEFGGLPTVEGDPAQLVQLFQNLIGNGVKFVAPGVRPHVVVSAARDGRALALHGRGQRHRDRARATPTGCSACSSGCTRATSSRARGSAWRSRARSSSATAARSRRRRATAAAPASRSRCRLERTAGEPARVEPSRPRAAGGGQRG